MVQPGCEDSAIRKGGKFAMRVPTGRSERRIAKAVGITAHLSDGSSLPDGTLTENVSTRGARIVTESKLQLGEMIEIHFPDAEIQFHGRVVYSQQLLDGRFATGLEMQIQDSGETGKGSSRDRR